LAGGDPFISNILRTVVRGGLVIPPFVPAIDECLGAGSSAISSMLRTGDRGTFVKGEAALPCFAEPIEPFARAVDVASSKANTSLRSSSNMDSRDICLLAMMASAAKLGAEDSLNEEARV